VKTNFPKFVSFQTQKIVNLDNVASYGLIEHKYKESYRIVFNMTYGITLPNTDKIISDYVYWETSDNTEFKKMQSVIKNYSEDWICSPDNTRYINPEQISSIVIEDTYEDKLKIIFNLSHTVSMKTSGLTSEFVYFKFNSFDSIQKYKAVLKKFL